VTEPGCIEDGLTLLVCSSRTLDPSLQGNRMPVTRRKVVCGCSACMCAMLPMLGKECINRYRAIFHATASHAQAKAKAHHGTSPVEPRGVECSNCFLGLLIALPHLSATLCARSRFCARQNSALLSGSMAPCVPGSVRTTPPCWAVPTPSFKLQSRTPRLSAGASSPGGPCCALPITLVQTASAGLAWQGVHTPADAGAAAAAIPVSVGAALCVIPMTEGARSGAGGAIGAALCFIPMTEGARSGAGGSIGVAEGPPSAPAPCSAPGDSSPSQRRTWSAAQKIRK